MRRLTFLVATTASALLIAAPAAAAATSATSDAVGGHATCSMKRHVHGGSLVMCTVYDTKRDGRTAMVIDESTGAPVAKVGGVGQQKRVEFRYFKRSFIFKARTQGTLRWSNGAVRTITPG